VDIGDRDDLELVFRNPFFHKPRRIIAVLSSIVKGLSAVPAVLGRFPMPIYKKIHFLKRLFHSRKMPDGGKLETARINPTFIY